MKIGEFARACNLPVSVLRYYDSYGLLKPVYIDRFTGYRYYSESQLAVCDRINELKSAGFTLAEIKRLFSGNMKSEEINALFDKKKKQLEKVLRRLDEIKDNISGGTFMETSKFEPMQENLQIPFVNDEKIIGKWEIVGEYNSRTEFDLGNKLPDDTIGSKKREIFFLPNGERYWCYSWSKSKLLIDNGESTYINDYIAEKESDGLYMFVKLKAYDYMQSGRTTVLVLHQLDNKHYTVDEITRKDNIDMPFANDESVIGKWKAVGFVQKKEDFTPDMPMSFEAYFKGIEFCPNGECTSLYGDEIISGIEMQEWTKGYVLRKWNSTACAYEITEISGKEYLFIEWKSGNYRWGGFDTDYYVFERA